VTNYIFISKTGHQQKIFCSDNMFRSFITNCYNKYDGQVSLQYII